MNKIKVGDKVRIKKTGESAEVVYVTPSYFDLRLEGSGRLIYKRKNEVEVKEPRTETALAALDAEAYDRYVFAPFMREASAAVVELAMNMKAFTTDDVWAVFHGHAIMDRRALGSVMKSAATRGLIRASKTYVPSIRPDCHRRPLRVWKSLIFVGK